MANIPYFKTQTTSNFVLGGGDGLSTAALIGKASFGNDNTLKMYSSFSEIKKEFKSGEVVDAAQKFFIGGGQILNIVRIAGSDKAAATLQLNNTGSEAILLTGLYVGTHGNTISVTVTENGANRDVVITDGTTTEKYEDLSTNTLIVSAINASSVLVTASETTASLIDASSATFMAGGDDGDTLVDVDYTNILSGALMTTDWDYLIIPGKTTDSFHTTIAGLLDNRAVNENKYSIYVTGVDKFEDISTTVTRTASDSDGRLVIIHTALFNGSTEADLLDTTKWLDASYTAALFVGKLCNLAVNTSPTFKSLPMVGGKLLTNNDYNKAERQQLTSAGFIVIDKTFTNTYGAILAVTKTTAGKWNEMLDNQRKVDYIKTNVYDKSKTYIGNPNDDFTRASINSTISSFLNKTKNSRIIESYELEVLKGTDPREVNINASVKLINELDYINFSLVLNT